MASTYVPGSRRKAPPSSGLPDTPPKKLAVALKSQEEESWQGLLMSGVARQPVPDTNPWEIYRKTFPELKLNPIPGDKLSLFHVGDPNPKLSLKYWKLVQQSLRDRNPEKAAYQLLELNKDDRLTFMCSGWVRTAVAEIVLEHDGAAQMFVQSYWKAVRYVPLPSRDAALEALCGSQAHPRKYWLSAVQKIVRFYKDNPKPKERAHEFAQLASIWYIETQTSEYADCFSIDELDMIAKTVFQHPGKPSGYIADRALAALFPNTSHSTLIHLRAEIKRRGRAIIAMKSDDELQIKKSRR